MQPRPLPVWPFGVNRQSPQARGLVAWWNGIASRGKNAFLDVLGRYTLSPLGAVDTMGVAGGVPAVQGTSSSGGNYNIARNVFADTGIGVSGDFSVSAWVRLPTLTAGQHLFVLCAGNMTDFNVMHQCSIDRFGKITYDNYTPSGGVLNATNTLVQGSSYHVGWIRRGSTVEFYTDGVGVGSGTPDTYNSTTLTHTEILGFYGYSAWGYKSVNHVSEVRLWNRALSAVEMVAQYQNRWDLYSLPARRKYHAPAGRVFRPVGSGVIGSQVIHA